MTGWQLCFAPSPSLFFTKYFFLGQNTVFSLSEYCFWFLKVGISACIIGSAAILFLAILLHSVYFILHLSLHKLCLEKNTCTGKTARIESQNTFVCERAIFGVFNSFTVKKVYFFTINVKFKVILSSKSGGGGYMYRPSPPPHPK